MVKRFSTVVGVILASTLLWPSSSVSAEETRKGLFRNIMVVFIPPTPEEQAKIATTVGLTDEQKQQMKAVSDRYRANAETLKRRYASAYQDVVHLMEQSNPNKSTVNSKLRAFHSTHKKVVDQEVRYWIDFKTILTPEQNKKFWNVFEQNRIRS